MKCKILIFLSFLFHLSLSAQNIKNEKFGVINVKDFNPKTSFIADDPAAIILSDVGLSEFHGNTNGNFTIFFKHHKKILIRKKSAFDRATFSIKLYRGDITTEEKLEDVEAAIYNLIDGKIVTTKLNNDGILKEKYDKYYFTKKFTLPEVKEGSIIEIRYTFKTQFESHLTAWSFQDEYPTLWSEYQVTIPPMHNYVVVKKGDYKNFLCIDSSKKIYQNYSILFPGDSHYGSSSVYHLSGDAKWNLWAMKDIPSLKIEPFVANYSEHRTRFEFKLQSIKYSDNFTYQRIKSWFVTAIELLKSEDFGVIFNKEKNAWIDKQVEEIAGKIDGIESAKKIYNFVKDNFICNDYSDIYLSDEPQKIFKSKKGNVADINLLLTAMLYSKGFIAEPVILSKRGYGKINELSAILNEFNYVVCKLQIDSTTYFLDAADTKVGFGKLPLYCYNGFGRVIAEVPNLINLSSNIVSENKTTTVFISNEEKNSAVISVENKLGNYESIALREKLIKTTIPEYFKEISKSYSFETKIENPVIENQKNVDEPIKIMYDLKFNWGDEDIIYFNPLLAEITKENIFKADNRKFPLDLNFTMDQTYIIDIEIPTGYMVDEIPKSVRSKYNDNDGLIEYIVSKNDGHILMRSRFQLSLANFEAEEYESLRDFFGFFVKKQSDQIVFKKIKK